MLTIVKLITLLLGVAQAWLKRQDAQKLRDAGAMQELAKASLSLLEMTEMLNEVDNAVLSRADSEWLRSVQLKYGFRDLIDDEDII